MGAQAPNLQSGTGFYVTIATPKGSQTKKIEGDTLSVGRAEDCNLTIAHETLSRRHMTVLLRNGQCWVEDHGSSNGTYVNGKKLKPHTPSRVLPEDFVQLGQSGVRLSVSTEPQMWKSVTPSENEPEDKTEILHLGEKTDISAHTQTQTKTSVPPPVGKNNTIVTSTVKERKLMRQAQPKPELKAPSVASEEAERLVQEAQKRAATLIQEAELDAERRVEDIYRRAHETQAKMDEVYQRRLNEAYRSAEKIFQKSQAESEVILNEARQKSSEIRAQAEGFVMDLRRRTEEDCERILDEAQQTARELKESRLAEADEMIRKKEDELIKNTREAMSSRLARFEDDLVKEAARQREVLETELNDRRALLEEDSREQSEAVAKLKAEVARLTEERENAIKRIDSEREEAVSRLNSEREAALARLNEQKERGAAELRELDQTIEKQKAETAQLKSELETARKEILEGQSTLGLMRADIERYRKIREEAHTASEKVKNYDEQIAAELLRMREKFAEDKAKLQRVENKNLEEMKLATTRKIKAIEDQMLEELAGKRDRLSREINLMTESFLKENPKATGRSLKPLQEDIARLFDKQIATMSRDPGAKEKQMTLVALKGREKARTTVFGILVGVAIAFGGQKIQQIVNSNQSPMARRVSAVQEERKQDLERRKFNPDQTQDLRGTYTDSVIYTKNFTTTYLNEEFQRKLLQAVTPFLLKTWRVEEDKVIQLLASSSALVKTLADRREGIHPDFVPQGIEKMREIEAEAITKMRQILGSQVRVESFKKFEKKFFEDYSH